SAAGPAPAGLSPRRRKGSCRSYCAAGAGAGAGAAAGGVEPGAAPGAVAGAPPPGWAPGTPRLKLTVGALWASAVAVNNCIGLEPPCRVLAQITVGKVRSDVL